MNTVKQQIVKIFKDNDIDLLSTDENKSLIQSGIVDSMTFVNILLEIEETFNIEIDFENIDMNSITTVNDLCNIVASMIK